MYIAACNNYRLAMYVCIAMYVFTQTLHVIGCHLHNLASYICSIQHKIDMR